jgi:hypothetical protein
VSVDLLAVGATLLHDAQLHELKSWVMLDVGVGNVGVVCCTDGRVRGEVAGGAWVGQAVACPC